MKLQGRAALAVLWVAVLAIYGVPLALGWAKARRAEGDPALLRQMLRERGAREPGAFPQVEWIAREMKHAPGADAVDRLVALSESDRPFERIRGPQLLLEHFPAEPAMLERARAYLLDPRQSILGRQIFLRQAPEIAQTPLGDEARALIDTQRGLFPASGYFNE